LFIAGPPVLLVSVLLGMLMGDMMSMALGQGMGGDVTAQSYMFSAAYWLKLFVIGIFGLVSSVMTYATINCYIVLYIQKQTNKITVSEVWTKVRSVFWMYVGTMVLFVILVLAFYLVIALPMVFLAAIAGKFIFLLIFAFLIIVTYFLISISLMLFIRTYEKKGFFDSMFRSMKLVRGKWWSTFGLIMLLFVIVMVISYILVLLYTIIAGFTAFHSVNDGNSQDIAERMPLFMGIYMVLLYLLQTTLQSVPQTGIAFQYFNLVELKESKGLMDQIDSFGQPQTSQPAPSADEDQY
jgi:hypothetical protein